MRNAAVDIETSGAVKGKHEILEIGIVILDDTYNPTKIKFSSYIKPTRPNMAQPEAMAVNGLNIDELVATAPTPMQVRGLLLQWKEELFGDDLFVPLGHNYARFDSGFLELFLGDFYDKIFHYHCDDSLILARALRKAGKLQCKCNLKSLCEYLGIEYVGAHRAVEDAILCAKVYQQLLRRF